SGERDFERAALPLAGDRAGGKSDREHRREDDRNRMNEAESERAGKTEDVAAAEAGELFGKQAALQDRTELRPEPGVDDRQEHAPDRERARHHRKLHSLKPPG